MGTEKKTTVRTEEKSFWKMSTREMIRHVRGKVVEEEIGEQVTLDYDTFDYICQSCGESIAPTLDDFESWGKCPHCENRHTQAVKTQAGISNLFSILGLIAFLTVIGALIGPGLLLVGAYYKGKTQRHLQDPENRIGRPVDGDGNTVEEVMEYIGDGWVIKSQTVDGFTMEKTTWGSRRMHLILALTCFWTLGWANAIYAFMAHDEEKKFIQSSD